MALMMIGPQSTQTTRSLFHIGLATSAIASVSIWLALPSRNFGLPAVSASDGENLSDFSAKLLAEKMWRNRRAMPPTGCANPAARVK
jgi:hypothetical protein